MESSLHRSLSSVWNSTRCLVRYCCCGCSLRDGSLFIGWIALILSAFDMLFIGYEAAGKSGGWWLMWITMVVRIIDVLVSILLLNGIYKDKTKYIKIAIFVSILIILYDTVETIALLFYLGKLAAHPAILNIILYLLFTALVHIGLTMYFIVVLRSYAISVEQKYHDLEGVMA